MINLNSIFNEDCIDTFSKIDDKSVDLVIADPPYDIVSGGSGGCVNFGRRGSDPACADIKSEG